MCYHQSARQVAQAGRSSGRSTKKYKVFTSQKGLRSTGGPDLLKFGLPGGGVKSAKVAQTPYVYYSRAPRECALSCIRYGPVRFMRRVVVLSRTAQPRAARPRLLKVGCKIGT